MMEKSELFPSEYQAEYTRKEMNRVPISRPTDDFAERVEDWQIDLRKTSDLLSLAEKLELVKKLEKKYNRTVYQDYFQNPAARKGVDAKKDVEKEKNFERELLLYVQNLYYDPHNEKVLAPPVTSKRVFGYMTPKFLHAQLSTYQDIHGRAGGDVMLKHANIKHD